MIPSSFKKIIGELGVQLAAVAEVPTGSVQWVGDLDSYAETDLRTSLFGDEDAVQSLASYLLGQKLPRTWKQGDTSCVVCKPSEELIVGLFIESLEDPIEQYRWSVHANSLICSVPHT